MVLTLLSCEIKGPEARVMRGNAFGTTYAIQYFSTDDLDLEKGIDSIIYAVNRSVSTYMPGSDISKINRGDTTVVVDEIFKEVYEVSKTVYTSSKGFFDPTVGVLRNAYGFGDEAPLKRIDSLVLDSLRQYVGFRKVALLEDGTVRKQHPEIYLDFNAVAKGYGIDKLGSYIESKGISNYIIELGGELLARGKNLAKNKSWIVGVESTRSELGNRSAQALAALEDRAMAASGNYRKFRIDSITGKKYVHTINPHTGKAQQSNVTSAAVTAPTCALADAYATAFMAMGLENAMNLLPSLENIDAYLTYSDVNNSSQVYFTEGFRKMLQDQD